MHAISGTIKYCLCYLRTFQTWKNRKVERKLFPDIFYYAFFLSVFRVGKTIDQHRERSKLVKSWAYHFAIQLFCCGNFRKKIFCFLWCVYANKSFSLWGAICCLGNFVYCFSTFWGWEEFGLEEENLIEVVEIVARLLLSARNRNKQSSLKAFRLIKFDVKLQKLWKVNKHFN